MRIRDTWHLETPMPPIPRSVMMPLTLVTLALGAQLLVSCDQPAPQPPDGERSPKRRAPWKTGSPG